jgi:hypothetical protein
MKWMSVLLQGVLIAVAAIPGAKAAPQVVSQVSAGVDVLGDVTFQEDGRSTPGSVSVCVKLPSGCLTPDIASAAQAFANTDVGTNRASVFVRSMGEDTVSSAEALSFWKDDWTFSVSPLSTGSFVSLRFRLDGNWDDGQIRYQFGVFDPTLPPPPPDDISLFDLAGHPIEMGSIAGASFDNANMVGFAFGSSAVAPHIATGTSKTGSIDWTYELRIQPVDGRVYTLAALLGLSGSIADLPLGLGTDTTPFGSAGEVDFNSTAALTQVILPAGVTFTSAAGASYNVTLVPEAETWAMLLAGLGLLGLALRRRPR